MCVCVCVFVFHRYIILTEWGGGAPVPIHAAARQTSCQLVISFIAQIHRFFWGGLKESIQKIAGCRHAYIYFLSTCRFHTTERNNTFTYYIL